MSSIQKSNYRSGTYNTHTSGMKKIPCSTNSNFEVKNNKAMSGAWYKNFKTRDCNSCQQLCASETVCKGYEFDKTPNVNKNCHLYQNPTYRSGTYNTHTSGKKKFPCSDTDVFEVKNNKAMSGAWYKNSKTIDCNSCQQLCASEAVCNGYEFDKTPNVNKNCHLYQNPVYRSGTYNTHTSGMRKIFTEKQGKYCKEYGLYTNGRKNTGVFVPREKYRKMNVKENVKMMVIVIFTIWEI